MNTLLNENNIFKETDSLKILIVANTDDKLNSYKNILSSLEYEVETAITVNQGISLLKTLNNEIKKVIRFKKSISLCMLKIKNFKAMKGEYSKKEFDKLLNIFSQNLGQLVNENDTICYYDENLFAFIIPDISFEEAELRIGEIKNNMENISFFIGNTSVKISLKSVTVSSKILKNPTEKELLEKVVSLINES